VSRLAAALVFTSAMQIAVPASATTMTYSGTGLANPAHFIDFSDAKNNALIGNAYAGEGVTFVGLYGNMTYGSGFVPTTAPAATNFNVSQSTIVNPFQFVFGGPISAVSFFLVTDGAGTSITSYLGNAPVETLTAGSFANNGANFFGFTQSLFDRVVFTVAGDHLALVDNLSFSSVASVPEPAPLVLLGLGIVAIGATRRRVRA
jgi:hypothetical protein